MASELQHIRRGEGEPLLLIMGLAGTHLTWGAGGPGSALTEPEVARRLAEGWSSGDRERALRVAWEANVSPAFAARDDDYAVFRERALELRVPLALIQLQLQAISRHDVSARLGEIEAPTLVVHGELDRILGVDNGWLIARAIPGARLEVLDGIGHLFWLEEPERSAALIREHARAAATAG